MARANLRQQHGGVSECTSGLSCSYKLNCLTSRFLRFWLLVLALACSLSGVGCRSCQCGIFSAVRLDAAESWEEFWFLQVRIKWGVRRSYMHMQRHENEGTDLSERVSFKCFTLGVVGASFVTMMKRRKLWTSMHQILADDEDRL